ncbi:MAG TPA: phosphodiester glycosidase family protein [Labilithrix sp.]
MIASSSACRRRAEPRAIVLPAPAGGAPAIEADAGDAVVEDARRYPVRTWSFPLATHDVRIEDVGLTGALDGVLERTGAELVVNGGFFDREGKPLGLAMSGGAQIAPLAKSLSGGVVTIDSERARLFATESFAMPEGVRFAVQCRPRLVVSGAANVRSDDGKRSERTALCLKDGGRTLDVVVVRAADAGDEAGPSLFALGRYLATHGCEDALNLDGGPSTGAAWRESGAIRFEKPRGPVRHAIAIVRR